MLSKEAVLREAAKELREPALSEEKLDPWPLVLADLDKPEVEEVLRLLARPE